MNVSDLTKAIEVACAKSLADKAFAPVALEPKSLRDLMVPEVLVTENETTVVYINEHGVRVRACTIGPNASIARDPDAKPDPEYMAHHLNRACKQVLTCIAHKALRQGLVGLIVSTPHGQVVVSRPDTLTLLDAEWDIRVTLTTKPISFE